MGGKVLIVCDEKAYREHKTQLFPVFGGEPLLARTVGQCRRRFSGESPIIVSCDASLRAHSQAALSPSRNIDRMAILSEAMQRGGDSWTILLFGEVLYSNTIFGIIASGRAQFPAILYGNSQGAIYACTYTNPTEALKLITQHSPAQMENYTSLQYILVQNSKAQLFDCPAAYRVWLNAYLRNQIKDD